MITITDPTRGEGLVEAFEALWDRGSTPPAVSAFLDAHPDASSAERLDVVLADQRRRADFGDTLTAEEYLRACPDLASDPDLKIKVVRGESSLAEARGASADPDSYATRFPELSETLTRQAPPTDPYATLLPNLGAEPPRRGPSPDPTAGPAPGDRPMTLFRLGPPDAGEADSEPDAGARFSIRRQLGAGGMGVVYLAYDHLRDRNVALKMMRRVDPAALQRFKREFRALADVAHPNLATLYELVAIDGQLCFTMELVEGVNFLAYVRPGTSECDPARLRAALAQLAAGLHSLHAAGKIHRDLKPSNVLVTAAGRVVILDFGLVADLGPGGGRRSTEHHVVGTVDYMSPEQAGARAFTQATDWYSVGVMIYQALVGRLPFAGAPHEILPAKQASDPPPPSQLDPRVPADLDTLCVELLRRDPGGRPTGDEVIRRLAWGSADPDPNAPSLPPRMAAVPLVGRAPHLETLAGAFAAAKAGRTVVVCVHGRSGVGKSTLVQRLLDDLAADGEAVVLAGRCYERESVPYKALDSIIDALARYLDHLPNLQAEALLPRDMQPLVRAFPVLSRIAGPAPRALAGAPDPQELRHRAAEALRELLARIGDRRPLVLAIDDLQWSDVDSATLLAELLRPPDPPVLLVVASYRDEDIETSPFLRALLRWRSQDGAGLEWRDLVVEALNPDEAQDLALALMGGKSTEGAGQAMAIARESGGNPFFVHELAQSLRDADGMDRPLAAGEVALDRVLMGRVAALPQDARRLLEVIAVSGRPIGQAIAYRAAEIEADGRTALAVLRSNRLVRGTAPTEKNEVETYHDRVREAVVTHLEPATMSGYHRRLALELETSGRADPEAIAVHFLAAGEALRAGEYYATAAALAADALAFDRAATLYRLALKLRPTDDGDECRLRKELGDALANAGRGEEAAGEYLAGAEEAPTSEGLELRRRAAMQLLISGHVDDGLAAFRDLLRGVGIGFPNTPRRALVSLLWGRARLLLRGLHFRPRDASEIPQETIDKVDICWLVAIGLSNIDVILGADFQTRGLIMALNAGDPIRIARSLIIEASHASSSNGSRRKRPMALFQKARALVRQIDEPYTTGLLWLAEGVVAYFDSHFRHSLEMLCRTEEHFHNHCPGAVWEIDTVRFFELMALADMGEITKLIKRRSALMRDAQDRGDLYAESNLSTYCLPIALLAADDPDEADRQLSHVMDRWSQRGFHLQHHNAMYARVMIELYRSRGTGPRPWEMIQEWGPYLKESCLLRILANRIDIHHCRGRGAIAAAMSSDYPKPLLRQAESDARRLERERLPVPTALAQVVRAGIAGVRGDLEGARVHLTSAAHRFNKLDMKLWELSALRRLGALIGGDEGGDWVARADAWMTGQMIRNPARMTAMLCPGFSD